MITVDTEHPLLRHASHEVPKAFAPILLLFASRAFNLPWQQIGYILGVALILLQGGFSVWKWRRMAREGKRLKVHVPPPQDG